MLRSRDLSRDLSKNFTRTSFQVAAKSTLAVYTRPCGAFANVMRAVMLTVGSRGDAEPFCSLASALSSRGHAVDLFLQPDLHDLAPSVAVHALPFCKSDFYRFLANPSHGADDPNPRVRFTGCVADLIGELVLPCAPQVLRLVESGGTEGCVIIASTLAKQLALAVGEKAGVPVCMLQLQPLVPTTRFPHFSRGDDCVRAILNGDGEKTGVGSEEVSSDGDQALGGRGAENTESYWALERYLHQFLRDHVVRLYAELALPPCDDGTDFDKNVRRAMLGQREDVMIVNAFSCGSSALIPACEDQHDSGQNIVDAGALADAYVPGDWSPPVDLVSFLDAAGPRPVCVSYGSMPFDRWYEVVSALKLLSRRAVLIGMGGKVNMLLDEDDMKMFMPLDTAPYAWLLPKCSMLLCHGGAGTVHAALRAGIPAVISPLMGDQFFFAALLKAKGLGVQCGGSLTSVTGKDIADAVEEALLCKENCRQVGEAMQSVNGVDVLVDALDKMCAQRGGK